MKLALVNLERNEPDPPLGLAYIASYVRKYGNFDNTVIVDKEDPIKCLRKEKPDVVGFSAMTYDFYRAKVLAEQVKRDIDVPLILGGHHISLMPQHFASSGFDIAVIGEGEQTMLELVQMFEKEGSFEMEGLKNVKGIIFNGKGGKIEQTEKRQLLEIDTIPFPARDLLKMKEYYITLRKATYDKFGICAQMITSRGCPYNCVFCSTSVFWQKARFHSAKYVVNEIKELVDKYKIENIIIWDDLFIVRKDRMKEIAEMLKKEGLHDLQFHVCARANLINEEVCNYMKDMNVTAAQFGLESGSERVLKYLKTGNVTVEQNRNALAMCKKFGIRTIGSFIIGCPGEGEEDLKQTSESIQDKNLDQARVFQLTPFPKTEIWEYAKQKGLVSDSPDFDLRKLFIETFREDMVLTDKISPQRLREWYNLFQKEAQKKLEKRSMFSYAKSLKAKHLKYLFTKRFLKKALYNRI